MNLNSKPYKQAAALGIVAGMRAMYAPAIASHMYSRHQSPYLEQHPLEFMQTITASKVFKVLAAAELVGDKMPNAPDRISAPGLAGRIVTGALSGAVAFRANGKQPVLGGLIGAAAAVASSFGCFYLRRWVVNKSRIADPIAGAVEDGLVISAGVALCDSVLGEFNILISSF